MQFRTIVKDPEVLEKYFSPLFLNLKEGECLEEYRQNKAVDDFLNAIPKTYEAEDLKAFYEKTGIKVEHQRFWDCWSYTICNPSGKGKGVKPSILDAGKKIDIFEGRWQIEEETEEDFLLGEDVEDLEKDKAMCDYHKNDITIELQEGDWQRWQRWEKLEEKANNLLKKYWINLQQLKATDFIKTIKYHVIGKLPFNTCNLVLTTEYGQGRCDSKIYDQRMYDLKIRNEELTHSIVYVVENKEYEMPDVDELNYVIYETIRNEALAKWEENYLEKLRGHMINMCNEIENKKAHRIMEYLKEKKEWKKIED